MEFDELIKTMNDRPIRDPERIDKVLKTIGKYWKANPDLRLMQLLYNACRLQYPDQRDFFFVEDEVVRKAVKRMDERISQLDTD